MPLLEKQHLIEAGVPGDVIDNAVAHGLTLGQVLGIIVQYGPTAINILQTIFGMLPKKP